MSTRFFYGQIVRVRLTRHGNEKLRPVVIVTPNEAMLEGAPLVGVAITGTPDPPTGFEVPLPWQPQGRSRTGLDKSNAAVCRWFVAFTAADVIDTIGHVPPEPMRRIEEAIRRFRGGPAQQGDLPPRQTDQPDSPRVSGVRRSTPATDRLPEAAPGIPPGIFQSQQAFWRDLSHLLSEPRLRGRWVCYYGDERIGTGTYDELIRECGRRGIPADAFYLGQIRPRELPPWEAEEVEPLGPQHREDQPTEP